MCIRDRLDGALVGKVHRGGVVKRRQAYDVRQVGAGGDARLKRCGVLVREMCIRDRFQADQPWGEFIIWARGAEGVPPAIRQSGTSACSWEACVSRIRRAASV